MINRIVNYISFLAIFQFYFNTDTERERERERGRERGRDRETARQTDRQTDRERALCPEKFEICAFQGRSISSRVDSKVRIFFSLE